MNCPKCKKTTLIIDSRCSGEKTRRRHKCLSCSFRFTTYEVIEDQTVLKNSQLKKVLSYRKVYPEDPRSDADIFNCIENIESQPFWKLVYWGTYLTGLSERKNKIAS